MPIVKVRDNLSDLIRKGAEKKQRIRDERKRHYTYYAHRQSHEEDELGLPIVNDDESLAKSSNALWFIELNIIKLCRFIAIALSFFILTVNVCDNVGYLQRPCLILDFIVNIYYIIDSSIKLISLYAYLKIAESITQPVTWVTYSRRSGVTDFTVAALCLIFIITGVQTRWMHLLRCIFLSLNFLEQMPEIDVLMSGIFVGLKSTLYTWLLMLVIYAMFSAIGVILFSLNDPYHFGSVPLAMWTYLEMCTLDNWSDVLNINYFGCNVYSANYYYNGSQPFVVKTGYGAFYTPVCYSPNPRRLVASLIFVLFILICGFVLVSLTVAFVTAGINNRLKQLKDADTEEDVALEKAVIEIRKEKVEKDRHILKRAMSKVMSIRAIGGRLSSNQLHSDSNEFFRQSSSGSDGSNGENPKSLQRTLTNKSIKDIQQPKEINKGTFDIKLLRALLVQIWSSDGATAGIDILKDDEMVQKVRRGSLHTLKKTDIMSFKGHKKVSDKLSEFPVQKKLFQWGMVLRPVVGSKQYHIGLALLICTSAIVELFHVQGNINHFEADMMEIPFQLAFSADLTMKILSCAPAYSHFFSSNWNIFDFVLVLLLWVPVLSNGTNEIFAVLKVLRIMRVFKMLPWVPELHVIMMSIGTSVRCLCYVVFLMFLFFYHCGVAGVFMFQKNDPFNFGNIARALLTLFQVSTLDNWGIIARRNMYGCMYAGYDPVYCDPERNFGLGWIAAIYFFCFIIVGVMVLVALFIGVIVTSMDLLQISISEEAAMLKKIASKQKQFGLSDTSTAALLEIFEMVDIAANASLSLEELLPIFEMISLDKGQKYEIFHKIDADNSGNIDFAEFCELIHLIGKAYVESDEAQQRKRKREADAKSASFKQKRKNTGSMKNLFGAVGRPLRSTMATIESRNNSNADLSMSADISISAVNLTSGSSKFNSAKLALRNAVSKISGKKQKNTIYDVVKLAERTKSTERNSGKVYIVEEDDAHIEGNRSRLSSEDIVDRIIKDTFMLDGTDKKEKGLNAGNNILIIDPSSDLRRQTIEESSSSVSDVSSINRSDRPSIKTVDDSIELFSEFISTDSLMKPNDSNSVKSSKGKIVVMPDEREKAEVLEFKSPIGSPRGNNGSYLLYNNNSEVSREIKYLDLEHEDESKGTRNLYPEHNI